MASQQSDDQSSAALKGIIFLLGPSGVGKSQTGKLIAAELRFLHIEIDKYPVGDGIDLEGLRSEWDSLCSARDASGLAGAIRRRAISAADSGAVLTFPSRLVLSIDCITAAARAGIVTVILNGSGAECLDSFVKRESETGRGLSADYWIANNAESYALMSKPEYKPYRELAFSSGSRRPDQDVLKAVLDRIQAVGD